MYNLFFLSFSVQINVKIEALQLGLRSRSFPDIRRYAIQLELRVCVDFLLPNIQSSSSLLDRISAAAMKNVEQRPKKSNIKGDFQAFELALKLVKIFFVLSSLNTLCQKRLFFFYQNCLFPVWEKDVTGDFSPNFGTNFHNFSQCDPFWSEFR